MARFVLVHGAFHGAWCWEPFAGDLEALGHTVDTFDLPGSGDDPTPRAEVTLDAYCERVCGVLAQRDERAVLVGHSMGGVAITQAAGRCPERIASLIYVAAYLPGDGQSLVDLTRLPEGAEARVQDKMVVRGDPPIATLGPQDARELFYSATDPEIAARAVARIGPQPVGPFASPVTLAPGSAGDRLPRSYVVCARDAAVPPVLQRRMAAERATGEVAELQSDHSPFLTCRHELAQLLDRFAARGDGGD